MALKLYGKRAVIHLLLPSLDPCIRADIVEHLFEVFAWLVVGATKLLASIVVDKRLGAVACLVGVWVPWIEWSTEWHLLFQLLFGHIVVDGFTWFHGFGHFDFGCFLANIRKEVDSVS